MHNRSITGWRTPLAAFLSGTLLFISLVLNAQVPKAFNWLQDSALMAQSPLPIICNVGLILLLSGLVTYVSASLSAYAQEQVAHDLRLKVIDSYYGRTYLETTSIPQGRLITLLNSDVELYKTLPCSIWTTVLPSLFAITLLTLFMITTDWVLFIVFSASLSALIIGMTLVSSPIKRRSKIVQSNAEMISNSIDITHDEMLLLNSENAIEWSRRVSHVKSLELRRARLSLSLFRNILSPFNNTLSQMLIVGTLAFGYIRVQSGGGSITTLLSFIGYLFVLLIPLGNVVQYLELRAVALPAYSRIHEFIQGGRPVDPSHADSVQSIETGDIEIPNIIDMSFNYPDDCTVFGPVSIKLHLGEVAIVCGPNGIGKSTLLKVLAGILVDITIDDATQADNRSSVTRFNRLSHLFPQDAPLVPGSLRDNLAFGNERVDDRAIRRVLERVDSFSNLGSKNILTIKVGRGGMQLSGGERQYIARARLILAREPVLLLDEPSSGVDTAGLNELVDIILGKLEKGHLVVIVSHDERFISTLHNTIPHSKLRSITMSSDFKRKSLFS